MLALDRLLFLRVGAGRHGGRGRAMDRQDARRGAMTEALLFIGQVVAHVLAMGCGAFVVFVLIEVAIWKGVCGGRIWWGISRAKAQEHADFYASMARSGAMQAYAACQAYEREVGCLHMSRWAPPIRKVTNDIFAAGWAWTLEEFDRQFGPSMDTSTPMDDQP
jgi:hypothetical protein